jgi:hypothetical protein
MVVALTVVGLSLLPYLLGWAVQTTEEVFSGVILDSDDFHSYLAVMRQGIEGARRFTSLYTPEPHRKVWIHTLYILLGHLVRLTGLPVLVVYHSARTVCGLLLLLVVDRFASLFLEQPPVRWTTFLLVALSSGLGWLTEILWPTLPGGISPIDFWLVDGYTFLAILTFPHFTLAWTALLAAFWSALSYLDQPRRRYLLIGGIAALIATNIHPTLALMMGSVLAAYGVVLWLVERRFPGRWVISGLPIGLGAGVIVVYLLLAFRADPVLASYGQAIMQSPPPLYYVVGYGLVGPLAVVGGVDVVARRDRRGGFLIIWVAAAFVLAYAPLNMQRRLVESVHIPLCLLAAVGLHSRVLPALARSRLAQRLARLGYAKQRTTWLVRSLLIVLTWLSSLYLVGSACMAVAARPPDLFHSADQIAAFDWLRDNMDQDDVLLSAYRTGNLVPAWTARRVFVGHWSESVNWPEREAQLRDFFNNATADSWRLDLLHQHGITHVHFGPEEQTLGEFDPAMVSYLQEEYAVGEVVIYAVTLEEAP